MYRKISITALLVLGLLLGAVSAFAQDDSGLAGVGDDLFPNAGNSGYEVTHYTLDITWDESNVIEAEASLEASALDNLSAFHLDFVGFEIAALTVNGSDAAYTREDSELIITPAEPLAAGDDFTVVVAYSGEPSTVDASGIGIGGWTRYDGGVFTASQPLGAQGWFPANDHPSDAASFTFRITVPEPYGVAANGLLDEVIDNGDTQTYVWEASDPMATYLATVNIAEFRIEEEEGPNGLPIINAFPADFRESQLNAFDRQDEIIAYFESVFGPYPFESAGAVVVDVSLGVALETQTRPLYGADSSAEEIVVVHELSHMWFGDSVRVADWADIWLNEGFASYSEALWMEHTEGEEARDAYLRNAYSSGVHGVLTTMSNAQFISFLTSTPLANARVSRDATREAIAKLLENRVSEQELQTALDDLPEAPVLINDVRTVLHALEIDELYLTVENLSAFFNALDAADITAALGLDSPLARPSAPAVVTGDNMFNQGVYQRGGLTLHALRLLVGDEAFFEILQTYYARFAGQTATTADFIGVAEEISGEDLGDFFQAWLYDEQAPDMPELGLIAADPSTSVGG